MLHNIPAELRALPQWVAVDMSLNPENGQPSKTPLNPKNTSKPANINIPSTWGTFDEAVATGRPVGFVLTKDDPYAIIDLDNKPDSPATPTQLALHNQILTGVDSYIERSISKRGYHVVVKGRVPSGVRYGNVELYSDGRYMIFTGDVVKAMSIDDYDEAVNTMYHQMKEMQDKNRPAQVELVQNDGHMEDVDIFTMGADAVNGDKFVKLCDGEWEQFGFPSQSEADLALMSMFTFYSKDNEQCRRLFRMTKLGKRDKYQKDNNHLDRMLLIARSKEPQPVDMSAVEQKVAAVQAELAVPPKAPLSLPAAPAVIPPAPKVITAPEFDVFQPPGILKQMADYMYAVAPRQVREYAVCASIAMLAGICGRAYNISGTGLNQYFIILGGAGTGKESMAAGIGRLTKAINHGMTEPKPVDIGTFASVQGIHKALLNQPCGLSILGEVGHEFKIMLSPKADPNRLDIKKAYLNLYNKSGEGESYSPVTYSKSENNMAAVSRPNLSLLGESTPDKFYETINEVSARDGFLSRLIIVEYTGIRYDYNEFRCEPPNSLTQGLSAIRDHSADLQGRDIVAHIAIEPAAKSILNQYDRDITTRINSASSPGMAELLVRSHVKVLKLAGLGAVAVNPYNPVVTVQLVHWASAFIDKADALMIGRFESGEVGEVTDVAFESIMRQCIKQYIRSSVEQRIKCRQPTALAETHIIGYSFIRDFCKRREPFKSHKLGYVKAMEVALKDMVDANILVQVPNGQLPKAANGHAMKGYCVGPGF